MPWPKRWRLGWLRRTPRDPEVALSRLYGEMRDQMLAVKRHYFAALIEEKRVRAELEGARKASLEWSAKAAQPQDDDAAKEALEQAVKHDKLAAELEKQLKDKVATANELQALMRELMRKVAAARHKKNTLIARHRRRATLAMAKDIVGDDEQEV